jgi:hypothetical protein
MLTLDQLIRAIQMLDPKSAAKAEVCIVVDVSVIDKGRWEGALKLSVKPVAGVVLGPDGLVLFLDKEGETKDRIMPGFPEGFKTGNPDIDNQEPDDGADNWKKSG